MKIIDFNLAFSIFIGIGATLAFDLSSQFLKQAFKIAPSNICLVGRWVMYMTDGIFKHANIGHAPRKRGECLVGWITHYMIGIMLAITFIIFIGNNWFQNPTLFPALAFGVVTVLAPFAIMQPVFGLGFAASKSPNPWQARFRSMMNHTAFGAGLYFFALLINWLRPMIF